MTIKPTHEADWTERERLFARSVQIMPGRRTGLLRMAAEAAVIVAACVVAIGWFVRIAG